MRVLALLAALALSGCDFAPKLSDNRADVPEAGSANSAAMADAGGDTAAMPAAPAPVTTPSDSAAAAAPGKDAAADTLPATATASNGFAPSFDCNRARSPAEALICNDDRLAQLDRRLTRAYAVARAGADATSRANLLEGQRQFLTLRDACQNAGCVARAYRDRLDDVEDSAARADDSCRAEIGEVAAARLVRQCFQASPATHPPCNAANSCAMIQGEIDRSCALFEPGDDIPGFCRRR